MWYMMGDMKEFGGYYRDLFFVFVKSWVYAFS
jgi:hypothetical protein